MKRFIRLLVLFCPLSFTAIGCDEDGSELPVNFEFRLLDEAGNPSTEFEEGENFVFSLSVINRSSEMILFQSMDTDEFMEVYWLNSTESDSPISMGKPYKNMFCTYQNGYPIQAKDTLLIELPWVPANPWTPDAAYYSAIFCGVNENNLLPAGSYNTGFKSEFYFSLDNDEYTIPLKTFEVQFEVQ